LGEIAAQQKVDLCLGFAQRFLQQIEPALGESMGRQRACRRMSAAPQPG
jgi:hypothetical protein